MKTCRTGKRVYLTEALAEDALLDAHSRNEFTHGGPVAVYACEECGYFHFTSKGTMNTRLAEFLGSGKQRVQQEANRWIDRLKK